MNVKWFCNLWRKVVHANTYTTTGITETSELEDEQKGQVQVSKEHSQLKFAKKVVFLEKQQIVCLFNFYLIFLKNNFQWRV